MRSLKYLIATAAMVLAITSSLAFGQKVYSTGTQGCCNLLDAHYTLIAAPPGVPLGNVYSMNLDPYYVPPVLGTWWINPTGSWEDEPEGDYTFRQTFTLASSAGAIVTGVFAADDSACARLNGGPRQCTPGGFGGFEHYTPFRFTYGFQAGTNTLDFVVHNEQGLSQSSSEPRLELATRLPYALGLEVAVNLENKLHDFGLGADGAGPRAGLISDAAGNLYGTTYQGGTNRVGTVFELTRRQGGGWAEKVLHNFGMIDMDGIYPKASLLFDAAGNLYGTTDQGGTSGVGTVFELSPRLGGGWTEKVLHNFGTAADGQNPEASLIWDAAGNLFGTTYAGGVHSAGTVFELTPRQDGGWTEKVLHNFGDGLDGRNPKASMVWDAARNLYGTASLGGVYSSGTVFELTPRQGGGWTEKTLHHFGLYGTDGTDPKADLVWDAAGNLYGTTFAGGAHGGGTVFELTPRHSGGWTEETLHNFGLSGTDGTGSIAGLIWDAAGNLYGTTYAGGANGTGTVFEMTPRPGGGWTETKLYSFGRRGDPNGSEPSAGLIFDAAGNLYVTTVAGGPVDEGTLLEIMHD